MFPRSLEAKCHNLCLEDVAFPEAADVSSTIVGVAMSLLAIGMTLLVADTRAAKQ